MKALFLSACALSVLGGVSVAHYFGYTADTEVAGTERSLADFTSTSTTVVTGSVTLADQQQLTITAQDPYDKSIQTLQVMIAPAAIISTSGSTDHHIPPLPAAAAVTISTDGGPLTATAVKFFVNDNR